MLAQLAKRNAADESYESPYTVEALRQGIDLGWFDKLRLSSFSPKAGGFRPPPPPPKITTCILNAAICSIAAFETQE